MSKIDLALIYAVRRKSDGCVKIGWTRDFQPRMSQLRTDYGPCDIVFCEPVLAEQAQAIEEAAHQLACKYWVENEWFKFPPPKLGIGAIKMAAYRISSGELIDCSDIRELKAATKLRRHKETKATNAKLLKSA